MDATFPAHKFGVVDTLNTRDALNPVTKLLFDTVDNSLHSGRTIVKFNLHLGINKLFATCTRHILKIMQNFSPLVKDSD